MKKKSYDGVDEDFFALTKQITKVLEKNKDGSLQPEQVNELLETERKFRDTILLYRQSTEIYKKFLQLIFLKNKNILSARPYFREGAKNFSKNVTPAIKAYDIEKLKTFNINYEFIKFVKDNWLGPFPKRAQVLYDRSIKERTKLIENNIPLAINRAKLFYRKTPKDHLDLMDFIGICIMGLAAGVDKWTGTYSPVFRSVIIGRAVGNCISSYSSTVLHFYPSDKRILYRANHIRGRQKIDDITELTKAVNDSFDEDRKNKKVTPIKGHVTVSELSSLISAASIISAEATVNEDGLGVYHYTADNNQNIEKSSIENETMDTMLLLAKKLPLFERKVLRLKGIAI